MNRKEVTLQLPEGTKGIIVSALVEVEDMMFMTVKTIDTPMINAGEKASIEIEVKQ